MESCAFQDYVGRLSRESIKKIQKKKVDFHSSKNCQVKRIVKMKGKLNHR